LGKVMSCVLRDRAAALHWTANAIREIVRPVEESKDGVERLRTFVAEAPVSLSMFGNDARYLAASRRWKSDRGVDEMELAGRTHCEVFSPSLKRWDGIYRRVLSGETLREELDAVTSRDGELQWLSWEMWPWCRPGGEVGGALMLTEYLRTEDCVGRESSDEWLLPFGGGAVDGGPCGRCASGVSGAAAHDYLSRLDEMIGKVALIEGSMTEVLGKAKSASGGAPRPAWTGLDRQAVKKKARALAAKAAGVARDALILGALLDTAGRERRGRSLN
jgi:PAS domain S-box-containing protein